jgi:transposase
MGKRSFSLEFKQRAIKLVTEQGYTIAEAAKSLGIDGNSIRGWMKKLGVEPPVGVKPAGESLEAEVQRLRKENQRLLLEREILKKATAFFANQ